MDRAASLDMMAETWKLEPVITTASFWSGDMGFGCGQCQKLQHG